MGKQEGGKKTYLHWLKFEKMNSYLGKNKTKIFFLEGSQVLGATGAHRTSINFILNVTSVEAYSEIQSTVQTQWDWPSLRIDVG